MSDARRMPPQARSARKILLEALDYFIDADTSALARVDHMKIMRLVEKYVDARVNAEANRRTDRAAIVAFLRARADQAMIEAETAALFDRIRPHWLAMLLREEADRIEKEAKHD